MIQTAKTHQHAVVIGGGLLGLEAANGLMLRGMQVSVVHINDWLMERQLDDVAGKLLQRSLEDRGLTFLMGAFFIGGQVFEYAALFSEGATISTNGYWSAFFLATGFHGIHVLGGLIAFLFVLGRTYIARKFTHEQAVSAIVVSYY